jgi:hypothetical protein
MDLEIGDKVTIIIDHDGYDFDWPCKVIGRGSWDIEGYDRDHWILKEMKGFRKKTGLGGPRGKSFVPVGDNKTRGGGLRVRKGHTEEVKDLYWVGEMVPEDQPDLLLFTREGGFGDELQIGWRCFCQKIHREDLDYNQSFYVQYPTDPEEVMFPNQAKKVLRENWEIDPEEVGIRVHPKYESYLEF